MRFRFPCILAICLAAPPPTVDGAEVMPESPRKAAFQAGPGSGEDWMSPEFDDSQWLEVRGDQLTRGWHHLSGGPRWVGSQGRYRLYFSTPSDSESLPWSVSAGFLGNISEAWWNGRPLGGWGGEIAGIPAIPPQRTVHAWPLSGRDFRVDGSPNVLAIRVRNVCGTGGLLGGPVGVYPTEELSKMRKTLESSREMTVMLVAAFALIWALLFAVVRITGDNTQPWLFAAGLFACTGAVHLTGSQFFTSGDWDGDPRWILGPIIVLYWAVPILSVWMIRGLCEARGKRREFFTTAVGIALAAAAQRPAHPPLDAILIYSVMLLLVGGVVLSRSWSGWRRGAVAAPAVLFGTICLAVAATGQIALFALPGMDLASSAWQPMDIGILAAVGSIGGTLLRRYSHARIREKQLAADVLESARVERTRVGRFLHDGVAQDLQYLLLTAKRIKGDRTDTVPIDEFVQGLGEAIGEIRRAAEDLQPLALRGATLREALESLAVRMTDRHGIPIQISMGQLPELIDSERDAIFRAAQEAIQNACRHAEARSINISVTSTDGAVLTSIIDDGRGFNPREPISEGLGLKFLRNQADLAGGSLVIESKPGKGTRIDYLMPLSKRAPRKP